MTDAPAPADRPTASERLAEALGRPAPAPLTAAELRSFEAAQDRAEADAVRIYGMRDQAA